MIFLFFKKIGFWGLLGSPYCGIGATIHIGQEMLCLPYVGFFLKNSNQTGLYLITAFGKKFRPLELPQTENA